jgi:hypothetical protein
MRDLRQREQPPFVGRRDPGRSSSWWPRSRCPIPARTSNALAGAGEASGHVADQDVWVSTHRPGCPRPAAAPRPPPGRWSGPPAAPAPIACGEGRAPATQPDFVGADCYPRCGHQNRSGPCGAARRRMKEPIMKVFTATSCTQGQRCNDFHWCIEGELVHSGTVCAADRADPDGGASPGMTTSRPSFRACPSKAGIPEPPRTRPTN